jgi:hypothetical protein
MNRQRNVEVPLASLVFKADGTCVGLYTEVIDLTSLGMLRVKRASRIEFDDSRQVWRVKDRKGFSLFTAPSRRECLEWEQKYFNKQMEKTIR